MRILLLLCLVAFIGSGCTITIKPLAQKKKVATSSRHHKHRQAMREIEAAAPAISTPGETLQNLHRDRRYKLISPTPNPEYEP